MTGEQAMHKAFVEAINRVGLDVFKRTSLFMSNEKVKSC